MRNLLVVFIVTFLSMLMFSTFAIAASYNSNVGILKQMDKEFQLQKQSYYCYLITDNAKDAKTCFMESKEGYYAYLEYMSSDISDPMMDACIQDKMAEWWDDENNSTYWYGFMTEVIECYMENQ